MANGSRSRSQNRISVAGLPRRLQRRVMIQIPFRYFRPQANRSPAQRQPKHQRLSRLKNPRRLRCLPFHRQHRFLQPKRQRLSLYRKSNCLGSMLLDRFFPALKPVFQWKTGFWYSGKESLMADLEKDIAKILITGAQLQARSMELGGAISRDYAGQDLLLVCVLKGAFVFLSDLARAIRIPHAIDFMAISSYGGARTESSGVVRILMDLNTNIENRNVLIVEDIIDTGRSEERRV